MLYFYLINSKPCCDLFCNKSPVMNVYKASRLPDMSTKTHKDQHTRSPLTPGNPFDPWKRKMLFKMTIPGVNKSHTDSMWLLQSSTLYYCIIAETSNHVNKSLHNTIKSTFYKNVTNRLNTTWKRFSGIWQAWVAQCDTSVEKKQTNMTPVWLKAELTPINTAWTCWHFRINGTSLSKKWKGVKCQRWPLLSHLIPHCWRKQPWEWVKCK